RLRSWTCDRVRFSRRFVRNTTRRSPRSSGSARSFISSDLNGEKNDADRNSRIGNVERGPVIAAEVELEKIDDVAVGHAVVQVSECAAKDQGERNMQKAVPERRF